LCLLNIAAFGQQHTKKEKDKYFGIYVTLGYSAVNYMNEQGYSTNYNLYKNYSSNQMLNLANLINNQRTIEIGIKINQKLAIFFSNNKYRLQLPGMLVVLHPTANLIGRSNYFQNIGIKYTFVFNKLEITPSLGYSFRNYTEFYEFIEPNPMSNVDLIEIYQFKNHGINTGVVLYYPLYKFLYITCGLEYNAYLISEKDKNIAKNSVTRNTKPNFSFFFDSYRPNWHHSMISIGLNCRLAF
jgi:hypothetical protein